MIALLIAAAAAAGPPAPAGPVEKLREVVVDAIRNCPKPTGDEIVVCARDRGVAMGYRLPKISERYVEAAARAQRRDTLGAVTAAGGQGSCSAVGGAGATGCTAAAARGWAEERAEAARNGYRP